MVKGVKEYGEGGEDGEEDSQSWYKVNCSETTPSKEDSQSWNPR